MAIEFKESCESCQNCYKLYKHPGNIDPRFKDRMNTYFGYVCTLFQDEHKMVFFDHTDGLCEEYQRNLNY